MYTFLRTLFIVTFLAAPASVFAAELSLTPNPTATGVGDTVLVTLSLSTTQAVNAFSGTLVYAKDALMPVSITDGSSVISVWLTHPEITAGTSSIPFAGLIPGGYSGASGKVFSILFRALQPGKTNISITNTELLRSDGVATNEPVTFQPAVLAIGSKPLGGYREPSDTDAPEPFTVVIARNDEVFAGDTYATFEAVDKSSGIDYYEVAETRLPFTPRSWQKIESPFRVNDQYLTSDVYVRAVDHAGNVRVAKVAHAHLLRLYEQVIGLILISALVLWWYIRRKRHHFSA